MLSWIEAGITSMQELRTGSSLRETAASMHMEEGQKESICEILCDMFTAVLKKEPQRFRGRCEY